MSLENSGIEKAQKQVTLTIRQEDATPKKIALVNQEIAHIEENDEVFGVEHEYSKKLQIIAEKLLDPKSKEKIECKVINAKDVNALACGNTVYVYAGMLAFCETEAELAYILAHEITHIESGDTWKEESSLSQARVNEYYADSVMHKLNDAGYNPVAIENMLRKLPKFGEIDHVHGSSADRQAAVRTQLKLRDHVGTTTKDDFPSPFKKDEEKIKKESKVGITERFMALARNRALYKLKEEELDKISLVTHFKFIEELYEEVFGKNWRLPSPYNNPIERWQNKRDLSRKIKQMDRFMEYIVQRISRELGSKETKDVVMALFLDFAKINLTDIAKIKKSMSDPKVRFNFPEGFFKELVEYTEEPQKFLTFLNNSSRIEQDITSLKIVTAKDPRELGVGNTPDSLANLISEMNFDTRISNFPQATTLESIKLNLNPRSNKDQKYWIALVMGCMKESSQDLKEEYEEFFKQFETEEENPKYNYQEQDQFKNKYKHIYFSAKKLLASMGISTTTSELSDFMIQNMHLFYSEQRSILKNVQTEIAHTELENKPIIQEIKIAIRERNKESLENALATINKKDIASFFNSFAAKDLCTNNEDYKFFIDFVHVYLQNKFQITKEHKEELLYALVSDKKFAFPEKRNEIWRKVKENGIDKTLEELHLSGDLFKPLLAIHVFEMMSAEGSINCEKIIEEKDIPSLSYSSKLILVKKFLSFQYPGTLNSKSLALLIESLDKDLQSKDLIYHAQIAASFGIPQVEEGYIKTRDHDPLVTLRNNFFRRLEQSSNFENTDRGSIEAILYSLSNLFGKAQQRELSQIKSRLRLDLLKLLNFDEALEKIRTWKAEGTLHYTHVDYVQENLMRNADSKHKLESLMKDYVKEAKEEHSEFGSSLVLLDKAFEDVIDRPYPWGMSANKILDAMLNSKYDDALLRQIMVTFWTDEIGLRFSHDESLDTIEGAKRHLQSTQTFDDYMDNFYNEISENDIEAILAKLLISPRGVLRYGQGIKVILKALEQEIGAEDPEFKKLILLVAQCGMRSVDPVRIFKPIADILRHRVLKKPKEIGENQLAEKRLLDLQKSSATDLITLQVLENRKKKQRIKNLMIAQYEISRERLDRNEPVVRNTKKSTQESIREKIIENSGIFKKDERENVTDPMEYVLALAQNMGAVGIRFLQILGQYIEIPPNYQARFADVFDAQRGQIKWTAIDTIEREMKTGPRQFQEFWSNTTDISETIGGGSLMTVYKVKSGGKDYVVKVLNPNAQEFIRQNIDDIEKILKDKKGNLGKKFPLTKSLVHDLNSWLNQDISSRHKKQETDEFAVLAQERKSEMALPNSIYTGSQYVMIEEFIPGKNLNQLQTSDAEQYRSMVKKMVADYRQQMQNFYSDGKTRIHTDPHVGNIRLGEDGNLYWLDRGYYIECTKEEMDILAPILSGDVNLSTARNFLNLLLNDEANKDKSKTKMAAKFVAGLPRLLRSKGNISQRINIFIKEMGIEIPIRYSLLFKNEAVIKKLME